jgi:hypothetical protein
MSMPKDFSEDGASGAVGGAANTANLGNGTFTPTPAEMGNGALAPDGWGGVWNEPHNDLTDQQAMSEYGAGAFGNGALGLMFDDGGVVPDQDPNDDGGQPPDPNADMNGQVNDRIALALTSVDSALQYGRNKHGLPADSGMNEGSSQQAAAMPMIPGNQSETPGPYKPQQPQPQKMAANMPAAPASQSESGAPRQLPAPGPLPPTSTPFGQRQGQPYGRVADNSDGDDDTPTIPSDEETA